MDKSLTRQDSWTGKTFGEDGYGGGDGEDYSQKMPAYKFDKFEDDDDQSPDIGLGGLGPARGGGFGSDPIGPDRQGATEASRQGQTKLESWPQSQRWDDPERRGEIV